MCVIGDSFVVGYGDETGRGWTAQLVEAAASEDLHLHALVAGIGGDTSEMILARWDEVDQRRAALPGTAVTHAAWQDCDRPVVAARPQEQRKSPTVSALGGPQPVTPSKPVAQQAN